MGWSPMARLCTRLASGRLSRRKAPWEKPVTRTRVPEWKSAQVTWRLIGNIKINK